MKLRLTQAGFETYTGQMGVVMFKDGLSENDVLPIDGIRISAAIGAEWEDGSAANTGQMYLNNMDTPAFIGMGESVIEQMADTNEQGEAPQGEGEGAQAPQPAGATTYTQEQLSQLADEKGIAGLREVADPLNIKGTSIVGLMEAILKAQGGKYQPQTPTE